MECCLESGCMVLASVKYYYMEIPSFNEDTFKLFPRVSAMERLHCIVSLLPWLVWYSIVWERA